jgi:glycerol-3-phosphate dehydrogenase
MLALESSLRGLHALLLEKGDFGGATSFNSLRILHGGLRYLQSLDLHRFRESVGERSWFLRSFPNHVQVLPCLMPLYGEGLRRPAVFRAALGLNDWLSRERNLAVRADRHLPSGRVVDASATVSLFPGVDRRDLLGGAVWYDACMPDSQRILMDVLRSACGLGSVALNYVEAQDLLKSGSQVWGILGRDLQSGEELEFRGKVVINAGGPWSREMAARFDRDVPHLFQGSIAWNVLFDREPPSDHALALKPKHPGARTYFLVPWKGMILAGTGHAPWSLGSERPLPSREQLECFVEDLNRAAPGLGLTGGDIVHVLAGLLPAVRTGSDELALREVIVDHGAQGGGHGLYSVSGVKFTTARLVAEKTLNRVFGHSRAVRRSWTWTPRPDALQPGTAEMAALLGGLGDSSDGVDGCEGVLGKLIEEESVVHLEDLFFRRTSLWTRPKEALHAAPRLCRLWGWDEAECASELTRVQEGYVNYDAAGR